MSDAWIAQFWQKVEKTDGCWLWRACIDDGYGLFKRPRGMTGTRRAHRIAYELLVGPIPAGLTIDHLCRVRHCVNPAHMEVVDAKTNSLRGDSLPAQNARKTHCIHGHPFTPENTHYDARLGKRACRTCKRDRERVRHAKCFDAGLGRSGLPPAPGYETRSRAVLIGEAAK